MRSSRRQISIQWAFAEGNSDSSRGPHLIGVHPLKQEGTTGAENSLV